jgi:hypothetical protein
MIVEWRFRGEGPRSVRTEARYEVLPRKGGKGGISQGYGDQQMKECTAV